MTLQETLFPRSRYYGQLLAEHLNFNQALQEFNNRVAITCSLETSGRISPTEAVQQLETLWQQL
ncbi:MAG: hypothetical protein LRZ84_21955 [Desertifilum sp.]|nr:hypothetical protein [Desertifilum sp.]